MKFECKFNEMPVGCIETDGQIPNGVSELVFDAYRSFAHLEMHNQFKAGILIIIKTEIDGNLIHLKLLEHRGNTIKVEF